MSHESLADALARLDALVHRHWGVPLLVAAVNGWPVNDDFAYLQARLPETGFDLSIGGNSFELVGRRHLEQIQYQFADRDEVSETNATIFIAQQDFNAIFVEQRGSGAVLGGLAGGEFQTFGKCLAAFFTCIADCFSIAYADGSDSSMDDAKFAAIRDVVASSDGVVIDAWMEYFYG